MKLREIVHELMRENPSWRGGSVDIVYGNMDTAPGFPTARISTPPDATSAIVRTRNIWNVGVCITGGSNRSTTGAYGGIYAQVWFICGIRVIVNRRLTDLSLDISHIENGSRACRNHILDGSEISR